MQAQNESRSLLQAAAHVIRFRQTAAMESCYHLDVFNPTKITFCSVSRVPQSTICPPNPRSVILGREKTATSSCSSPSAVTACPMISASSTRSDNQRSPPICRRKSNRTGRNTRHGRLGASPRSRVVSITVCTWLWPSTTARESSTAVRDRILRARGPSSTSTSSTDLRGRLQSGRSRRQEREPAQCYRRLEDVVVSGMILDSIRS